MRVLLATALLVAAASSLTAPRTLAADGCPALRVTTPSPSGGRLWSNWPGEFVAGPASVNPDGSIWIKGPWRAAGPRKTPKAGPSGTLRVTVRQVDGLGKGSATTRPIWDATFAGSAMWSVVITFPTEGCWHVIGSASRAKHSFTLRVSRTT